MSAESILTSAAQTQETPYHPKSEEQKARLLHALDANLLFRQLDPERKEEVAMAMREMQVSNGDIVIKQGDDGQDCYFTETGTLDVYVQPPGTLPSVALSAPRDQLGAKVLSYGPGSSFGELALMYLQPRAASVVATSDCVLWALDRVTFRSMLARADVKRRLFLDTYLKQVPLLRTLRDDERSRVSDAIEIVEFEAGETVLREGDIGTQFYMIINGIAEVSKADDASHPVTLLQRGDYFGELALLRRAPRAATVIASPRSPNGKLRLAVLPEEAFTRLLGPLSDIMARHAETHYGGHEAVPSAVASSDASPTATSAALPKAS